ncbi:hypothetical protein DdX_11896 [Ditylenchus destructor]|uniref:Uncharacterized protein n=1 Tax=Ditylenchus destructor TaxID=166010 RepID=A0AAD4R4A3_9BILA|nr:hypothetical protein DdX_11896 [Ditylenchus destructor]
MIYIERGSTGLQIAQQLVDEGFGYEDEPKTDSQIHFHRFTKIEDITEIKVELGNGIRKRGTVYGHPRGPAANPIHEVYSMFRESGQVFEGELHVKPVVKAKPAQNGEGTQ